MYRFYNKNSHGRFVNDCTIRAIATATNRTWNDTYKELSDEARKNGMMMDSVEFIENYLDKRYKRAYCKNITVGQFLEKHPYGTYVISMPNHLTCAINGINYDTFNTTKKKMWCAWYIPR